MTPKPKRIPGPRPFPWRCPDCREKAVWEATIDYTSHMKYEGKLRAVHLPELVVPKCRACGEVLFDNEADRQICDGLRREMGLLAPDTILANRKTLGLTQKQLAAELGVADETLSRWENDRLIQSRAMDKLLRLFFAVPEARATLRGMGDDPRVGQSVVGEAGAPSSRATSVPDRDRRQGDRAESAPSPAPAPAAGVER